MRRAVFVLLALVVVAVAVIVITVHRGPDRAAPAPAAKPSSTSQSRVPDQVSMQQLLDTRLSTLGAELSVGMPATLTIDDVDGGKTVYARVTVEELEQLHGGQVRELTARRSALNGYSTVYTMPVTLTVLGVIADDGSGTVPDAVLTATDLERFSVATHPGSDPLTSTPTLSTKTCTGVPDRVAIKTHQTLTWCVHAFANADSNTPTGGQYTAPTGPYQTPITWASKRYAGPAIP